MGAAVSVLLVDDNEELCRTLQGRLVQEGLECNGYVTDAQKLAERMAAGAAPDVVLLDVDMPGRDPFEVLEELGQSHSQTRIIMFSGHIRLELIDRAVDAGAWGYVCKSDGEAAVLHAIGEVAAGRFVFSQQVLAIAGLA